MPTNLTVSEQLTHCTVRIECEYKDGTTGTGTGFFFRFAEQGEMHAPAIVTNKHVIDNALKGKIHLTLADLSGAPLIGQHKFFFFEDFQPRWIYHPSPDVDLCVMPIGPLIHMANEQNVKFFYVGIDRSLIPSQAELSEFTALEDIIMIGYPNGIWDATNNMPIIRRGITATHPNIDYDGQAKFMIDAACFPGSSGSPVFIFNLGGYTTRSCGTVIGPNRVKLLGILHAGPQYTAEGQIKIINVPTTQRPVVLSSIPNNLGLVIKAAKLFDFDQILQDLMNKRTGT